MKFSINLFVSLFNFICEHAPVIRVHRFSAWKALVLRTVTIMTSRRGDGSQQVLEKLFSKQIRENIERCNFLDKKVL